MDAVYLAVGDSGQACDGHFMTNRWILLEITYDEQVPS